MFFYCFLNLLYFIIIQLFFNLFRLKDFYLNQFLLLITFYQLYANLFFIIVKKAKFCILVFTSFSFRLILFIDHIFRLYFHIIIDVFIFHLNVTNFLCSIYLIKIISFQFFIYTFKLHY